MKTSTVWGNVLADLLEDVEDGLTTYEDAENHFQEIYPGNYKFKRLYSWTKLRWYTTVKFDSSNDELIFRLKYS